VLAALNSLLMVGYILGLGPFRPRAVARATLSASRTTVWVAHLTGLVLGAGLITWFWVAQFQWQYVARIPVPRKQIDTSDIVLFAVVLLVFGIALTFVAALVVLPIAWRDETLGDTWRFALRTIRLFCPAWIFPTTLWAVTANTFFRGLLRPWIEDFILIPLFAVYAVWAYVIIARAAGVGRAFVPVSHDTLCEACGYSLVHLPANLRCPECGSDVDPCVRGDTRRALPALINPPDRNGSTSEPAVLRAWVEPGLLFSRLRADHPARPLLVNGIACFAVAGAVSAMILLMGFLAMAANDFDWEPLYIIASLSLVGTVAMFGLWSLGTGIVGVLSSIAVKRNLARAACVVAACTSGYFVAWAAIGAGALVLCIWLTDSGTPVSPFWIITGNLMLHAVMAVIYCVAVWRRMRYLRFANWHFPKRHPGNLPEPTEGRHPPTERPAGDGRAASADYSKIT
jgi:hypothetical protein